MVCTVKSCRHNDIRSKMPDAFKNQAFENFIVEMVKKQLNTCLSLQSANQCVEQIFLKCIQFVEKNKNLFLPVGFRCSNVIPFPRLTDQNSLRFQFTESEHNGIATQSKLTTNFVYRWNFITFF